MKIKPIYKPIIVFVSFLFFKNILFAQELGIQIAPGFMNYGGDIQGKGYTFKQAQFSISAAAIYSINKFSVRAGITHGKIQGDDITNTGYKFRNLSFATNIDEINVILQYDFLQMNDTRKFTPYIFAGIGYFHFNPYTHYNAQKIYLRPLSTEGEGLPGSKNKYYDLSQYNYPAGGGIKYKLSERILLGIEINSRFLYTDYIDDVSRKYPDENELLKEKGQLAVDLSFRGDEVDPTLAFPTRATRGNPKQKDNYYTTVFTFTYFFHRNPLFNGGINHTNRRALSCPKNIH